MGRWQPDARGRLQEAAMRLYSERGYDETTVADIAERAGLTKRTFFRYFADKREVIFYGSDVFRQTFVTAVASAPPSASAIEAVSAGVEAVSLMLGWEGGQEFSRMRQQIIDTTPELQERELIKLATVAADTAAALRERGVDPLRASVAGEAGMAVVRVAFPRWLAEGNTRSLSELTREAMQELHAATAA